ncbi:hypothetical protein P5P86_12105 [Nocardioides sp. BP30]|uniref:hypothetical protein n=1 Tax=Nocardioides sp. BP30 TaxID=3036374 RepID=UPI002468ABF8|nr:hypothetical protein [Nocardioides sp. BP30]WGL50706.1 hypothetical protein P5P86_12105 [Nocardioides sp. BP30]
MTASHTARRRSGRPVAVALPALTLALSSALALAACGGDSATDRACAARDDLSTSVQKVITDLRKGNVGDARDQLGDVRAKVSALGDAVGDLSAQERDRLQPQVTDLQDQLKALPDAGSLAELRTAIGRLNTSASTLLSDLGTDLTCS